MLLLVICSQLHDSFSIPPSTHWHWWAWDSMEWVRNNKVNWTLTIALYTEPCAYNQLWHGLGCDTAYTSFQPAKGTEPQTCALTIVPCPHDQMRHGLEGYTVHVSSQQSRQYNRNDNLSPVLQTIGGRHQRLHGWLMSCLRDDNTSHCPLTDHAGLTEDNYNKDTYCWHINKTISSKATDQGTDQIQSDSCHLLQCPLEW